MDIATKKLGMRKTKMGYGDKETGYIVGQSNVRKLGLVLIGASILFIIIGFTMQSDIASEKSNEESYLKNAPRTRRFCSAHAGMRCVTPSRKR